MKVDSAGGIEQLEKDKPRGKCRKWRLWIRSNGKKRSKRVTGTYRQAQCALEDFKKEVSDEVPDSETFAAYAAAWLDFRRSCGRYAYGTLYNDERRIQAFTAHLGKCAVSAITPEMCRKALTAIRSGDSPSGRRLMGSSMANVHACLHAIMQQAEEDGIIAANPMRHVKPPKSDAAERRALTPEELTLLLNRLDSLQPSGHVMALYLIACLGLRRGEACALLDADVCAGYAFVRHSVTRYGCELGKTKSAAGVRTVPVPPRLERKIDEWRAVREARGIADAQTLACTDKGGILSPTSLYNAWRSMSARLGCEGYTLHELRHSNLSMTARYLSPYDLQRYAGWSSLAMTRTYIHDDLDSVTRGVLDAWRDSRHQNATGHGMPSPMPGLGGAFTGGDTGI